MYAHSVKSCGEIESYSYNIAEKTFAKASHISFSVVDKKSQTINTPICISSLGPRPTLQHWMYVSHHQHAQEGLVAG